MIVLDQYPQKYMHGLKNVNVSGDYIYNSKNVQNSYIVAKLQDSKFCMLVTPGEGMTSDCYDFTHFGVNSELLYESLMSGWGSRVKFSWFIPTGQDIEYSMWCVDNKNLFGCVGLKKKQYCILNKQYSKEEYEALVAKIKIQMTGDKTYGEFFPPEASPFGYNETAYMYFPLTKQQALEKGYVWREPDEKKYTIGGDIKACEHKGECMHYCSTAFRCIPSELQFYEKHKLPLPKLCFNCRHANRVAQTNLPKLYNRQCAKCNVDIQTSYAPDRPEIVYCEQCYQQEVV